MTRRNAGLVLAGVLAACLLALAISTRSLSGAHRAVRGTETRLIQVRADAERVLALRARSQTVAAGEQPQQDAYQRVNATLATAGLSRVRVRSVTPAGDQALDAEQPNGAVRRVQSVRIVLEALTLDELGGLLERWGQSQRLWIITAVDCSHPSRGGSEAYDITLTASAVYIPDTPSTPARSP